MDEPFEYDDEEEDPIDFGEFRPLRIRGVKIKEKKHQDAHDWDDD